MTVNATADGIKGKDSVVIEGGTLTIVAGGDGIQAETDLVINNGTLTLHTRGGRENSSTKTSTTRGM